MGKKSKGKDKADRKARKRAAQRAADAGLEQTAPPAGADVPTIAPGTTMQTDRKDVGSTELAARLASLSTVLQRQLARADAGDGLTRARLSALALLVLGGSRTLGDLATAERVRPPTMTRLVQAMEADGLVVRERNPSDARSIIIRATPLGERQLDVGRARQIAPLAGAITQLPGSDRRQLDEAVDLLGRVLRDTDWELDAIPE